MRHNFANCWPFSSARKATRIVAERPPFLVFIRALRGRSTRNVPNDVCPVLTFNLLVPWEKVIAGGGAPPTAMRKKDGWRGDERRLPNGGVFVMPHAKSRFSCLATVCQRRDAGITSLRWKIPRCEWRRGHVTGTYLVDDWSECGWGCIQGEGWQSAVSAAAVCNQARSTNLSQRFDRRDHVVIKPPRFS